MRAYSINFQNAALLFVAISSAVPLTNGFSIHTQIQPFSTTTTTTTFTNKRDIIFPLHMAIDEKMESRLDGIRRSYLSLTERLADPDVLGDANLLRKVMSDRAQSEEVVNAYDEYCRLKEELAGAKELFQDAGDDADLREMAREEMKTIEPQMDELEDKIKILLLPKDPNDDRNVMLELRAGTGGSEANLFVGKFGCFNLFHKKLM